MFTRTDISQALLASVQRHQPLVGTAVGSGMFAKFAEASGADLVLLLNASRFRLMGLSSVASLLPFDNSNAWVMNTGISEVLPRLTRIPCIFGLCASDPGIDLEPYLLDIQAAGFLGIANFPTVGIIDGTYGEALRDAGYYEKEVEAIATANRLGLFTIAFVFNEQQAARMAGAGANVICAHLGFTVGGISGIKHAISIEESIELSRKIFDSADKTARGTIKMVYGGPVNSPDNAELIYRGTSAMGYIGGSSFETIPTETSMMRTTELFKQYQSLKSENERLKRRLDLHEAIKRADYIPYLTAYVNNRLQEPLQLKQLAEMLHLNRSYLSQLFKKQTGLSFSEWLIGMRIDRAKELLEREQQSVQEVARQIGYDDPSYFSRLFKKLTGISPKNWRQTRHGR